MAASTVWDRTWARTEGFVRKALQDEANAVKRPQDAGENVVPARP
jgi:hypothetical protein